MANKTFKNWDELLKYCENNIVISLETIGEEVKKILRNNVQKLWYERNYEPTHYTRTYELIDSITVSKARKIDNGYEVVVYFDTDKIREIQNIYRILYQKNYNNSQALEIIEAEMEATKERDQIILFIKNSQRGIMKGYTGS